MSEVTTESSRDPQRSDPQRIGLIAGGGSFPIEVARAARARGIEVVCAAVRHEVSPELEREVDVYRAIHLGRIGAVFRLMKRHGVRDVSWAGWIRKEKLFWPGRIFSLLPDWRMLKIWYFALRDRQSQTILATLAAEFEKEGLHVSHSARFCPELLVEEGQLTRSAPSRSELTDIRFGWSIAKRLADLDVGQSIAVLGKTTIAVEGIEGTDRNIQRAGELLPKGGFTVIKLAKEDHDMRFDVPAVGPETIKMLHQARGRVLALEAGRCLVFERPEVVRLADEYGISVVAYADGSGAGEA